MPGTMADHPNGVPQSKWDMMPENWPIQPPEEHNIQKPLVVYGAQPMQSTPIYGGKRPTTR